MKRFLIMRGAILAASVFSLMHLNGQAPAGDKLASLNSKAPGTAVSPDVSMTSADNAALASLKAKNNRMYSNFSREFKNATNIKVRSAGNSTMITCYVDGEMNKINYNRNGRWQYTLVYQEESRLPEQLRQQVNDAYPRYEIFGFVTVVRVGIKTAYLVMIENKTSWKRVRLVDNEIDVYEEYDKSPQQ